MSFDQSWKRPESVLVVIYTLAGEVLLLERAAPAGYWQSVTGSLDWGEEAGQAAVRELAEETGLAADGLIDRQDSHRFAIHPAWRARYAPDVVENTEHVFTLAVPDRVPVRLNHHEHSRYLWLPYDAALTQVSSATNRAAIEAHVPGKH